MWEYGVALRELLNGGGAEFVRLRHGAGRVIRRGKIAAGESWLLRLVARLRHGRRNSLLHLRSGIIGEGVAEILHDVEPVAAANHAQADHIVSRVEQIGAMRRREHEMFMSVGGIEIERDVFTFLIELRTGRGGQALGQGGLTIKLVRKFARCKHRLGVGTGCLGKAGIERQPRCAGFGSGLIRQGQKHLFSFGIKICKWNIRGGCRGWS